MRLIKKSEMQFTETRIKGAYVVDIKKISDDRGFFGRSYCKKEFENLGINKPIVQVNVSANKKKGTLRGLHMQVEPAAETKLVRCTRGAIFDVLVDLRPDSETFLQWVGVELNARDYTMLYIPEGCAHGYLTLEDDTDVMYQVTAYYTPEAEKGFRWNDPTFNIDWPLEPVVISSKDQAQPLFHPDLLKFNHPV